MSRVTVALVTAALALTVAGPAGAAEPESGAVSKSSPKVEWTGEAPAYFFTAMNLLFMDTPAGPQCVPQTCDEFALKVADKDKLLVSVTSPGSAGGFVQVQVEMPDGTTHFHMGEEANPTSSISMTDAPAGDYAVRVWTNSPRGFDSAYEAFAQLGSGAPAEVTPPPAPPAPQPQPQPQPAPAQSEQPAPAPAVAPPTLTIPAQKLSTRAAKGRKLRLAVASTGALTDVVATLKRGKKTIGRAKLASLDGAGRLTLALKGKLTKGTYRLAVLGKSATGAVVATTSTVKITR